MIESINGDSLRSLLYKWVLQEKLNNPFGFIVLMATALSFSAAVAMEKAESALLLTGIVAGIPVLFGALFNLQFGIAMTLIASFNVLWIKKFLPPDTPVGLTIDVLIGVMFLGMFIRQIHHRDWSFLKNRISIFIMIWIAYNILQLLNPEAQSRLAWLYTVRGMAFFIVLYFIAVYAFNSLRAIEMFIKACIFLSLLAALYGLYQEFIGMPDFEMAWLKLDPRRMKLVYQWGKLRVFSFLADPSTFGILMAYMGMFCTVLATGVATAAKRILLLLCAGIMFTAMLFSGTRTAYVLLPAGFFFFALLIMQRHIILALVLLIMAGSVIVMIPTGNLTLYRFQSAFKPAKDASMQHRLDNQEFIQPYIQTHPFGGGLGSTGIFGKRFSPHSKLAGFPPDSGYVRVAVELGWIGLLIYCAMMFVILSTGIKNYVSTKTPKIRTCYVAFLVLVFVLCVSNYPQDAIVQLPTSIIFYLSLAALVRLKDFDNKISLKSSRT